MKRNFEDILIWVDEHPTLLIVVGAVMVMISADILAIAGFLIFFFGISRYTQKKKGVVKNA